MRNVPFPLLLARARLNNVELVWILEGLNNPPHLRHQREKWIMNRLKRIEQGRGRGTLKTWMEFKKALAKGHSLLTSTAHASAFCILNCISPTATGLEDSRPFFLSLITLPTTTNNHAHLLSFVTFSFFFLFPRIYLSNHLHTCCSPLCPNILNLPFSLSLNLSIKVFTKTKKNRNLRDTTF